ncbi:MAG: DUF29 domain-containing protein [Lamprobacter sp.]|uniref:DUF29 domain-containing protein n=1 Tax=Lamprobacter sp. TaxID=3100796 RepID=UPI002B2618AA|nr:DUF29 domain-containing protein [Lamprobacter sp.]MEA3640791.1 DUF29 domain-containing protein [Lamprobacter sp.]
MVNIETIAARRLVGRKAHRVFSIIARGLWHHSGSKTAIFEYPSRHPASTERIRLSASTPMVASANHPPDTAAGIDHPWVPLMSMYETDFHQWIEEQSDLLRSGQLTQLDMTNLVEELQSMSARERRELINRLAVLLAQLLNWEFQPERRSTNWRLTINEQRWRKQAFSSRLSQRAVFTASPTSSTKTAGRALETDFRLLDWPPIGRVRYG